MKMKKLAAGLLALLLVVGLLAGCGDDDESSDDDDNGTDTEENGGSGNEDSGDSATGIEGTWTMTTIESDGVTYTVDEYEEEFGANIDTSIVFSGDSTYSLSVQGSVEEGTYELSGSTLTLTNEDGEIDTMEYNEDSIVIDSDELILTLTK